MKQIGRYYRSGYCMVWWLGDLALPLQERRILLLGIQDRQELLPFPLGYLFFLIVDVPLHPWLWPLVREMQQDEHQVANWLKSLPGFEIIVILPQWQDGPVRRLKCVLRSVQQASLVLLLIGDTAEDQLKE